MKYRWSLAPAQPEQARSLAANHQISPLLAQCLLNRGLTDREHIAAFLAPRLRNLSDPFLIPNMEAAVQRLLVAREQRERVVIFGDYDVDGVTSTTLLLEVLSALGWSVEFYLPHRMDEGYGLTREAVERCFEKYPGPLLLAVDCGSTAVDSIAWLKERGTDVIVVDHHQCSSPLPTAVALVNPRVKSESEDACLVIPFAELCSAGLAFKLAHALVKRGRDLGWPEAVAFDVRPLLDLVALGTIADLVPLTGENRIFARIGLDYLNLSQRPGLIALRQVAQTLGRLGCYEVGFQLGPRLNAAGRLENAEEALQLLRCTDAQAAEALANSLDSRNRQRQDIERRISEQVIGAIRARFDPQKDFVIVEGQLLWHIGVVGIVASRVLHEFYRPTIILGGDAENWRGSGRSIEGFDLAAALRECDDLLSRHGGHAMAAGLSLVPANLETFRTRLNEIARRTLLPEQLQPELKLDAEISLNELSLQTVRGLQALEPIGQKNPPVHVCARRITHQRTPQRMGKQSQHAKFWVPGPDGLIEAVWWNCGEKPLPKVSFDLAFVPQISEYKGDSSVQLKVLDWQPAS